MAWANIEQPFGGFNAVKMLPSGFAKLPNYGALGLSDFDWDNTGDSIIVPPNGGYSDVSDDKVVIRVWNYLSQYLFMNYQTYWFNGSEWTVVGSSGSQSGTDTFKYFIVLDDSSHTACCGGIYSNGVSFKNVSSVWYNDLLQYMEPIVTYNWEPVIAISGKGETANLARIKSSFINDGQPVTGAASSNFDNFKKANRVSSLVLDALPEPDSEPTTVTVKYDIPAAESGSYTYCKIVGKVGSMPQSVEDGSKIVDIDPTKDSVTIENLDEKSKYYFVIFTKDSNDSEASSDAKSITTGALPVYPEYYLKDIAKTTDTSHYKTTSTGDISDLSQYFGSDYILTTNSFNAGNVSFNSETGEIIFPASGGHMYIPVRRISEVTKGWCQAVTELYSTNSSMHFLKISGNTLVDVGGTTQHTSWSPVVTLQFDVQNEDVDYVYVYGGSPGSSYRVHMYTEKIIREEVNP